MNRAIIATAAALLVASPALAQTGSQGAKQYAPGQQPNTTAAPGHSESAPGQKMKNPATTGSGSGKKY
jgi:hypothetical protein